MKKITFFCFLVVVLGACTTTKPTQAPTDTPPSVPITDAPVAHPLPDLLPRPEPEPAPVEQPLPSSPQPPSSQPPPEQSAFRDLAHWQGYDPSPALRSFQKSCERWKRRDGDDWLNPQKPLYGQFKDWRPACATARVLQIDPQNARAFFQTHFEPVRLSQPAGTEKPRGLLTGYYAPILEVRRHADAVFSEPILARPTDIHIQKQPRKNINALSAKVLAYGRPIDVFFLQIQGSGRIKFPDGTQYRAAFNGHNSKPYSSIGRVLVRRGVLTKNEASKGSIENWMNRAGPEKTRALMNENARYIFFKTEYINPGEGPKGAMGVRLTPLGSMAVDPRYHPYGSLIWLHGKIPETAGDYVGAETGLLLSAQDTGGAIKGPHRGDVFFGIGDAAGARAGVTKHDAEWSVFLPIELALQTRPIG